MIPKAVELAVVEHGVSINNILTQGEGEDPCQDIIDILNNESEGGDEHEPDV